MADDALTDDDIMSLLSPEALAALKEFKAQAATPAKPKAENDEFVPEDFGKSQFWYDEETSNLLADEAVAMANEVAALTFSEQRNQGLISDPTGTAQPPLGAIACVSAPSVFRALVAKKVPNRIVLFEFDKRFGDLYGDRFSFYDVHHPRAVDKKYLAAFDFVIVDPPYLNVDCMSKTGDTIKLLHRSPVFGRTIYNTGAILEEAIYQVLRLRKLVWAPCHSSHLSNIFYAFANYPSARFGGFDKPIEAVIEAVSKLEIMTPESAQLPPPPSSESSSQQLDEKQ